MDLTRRQVFLGLVGSGASLSLFFVSGERAPGVQDDLIPVDLGPLLPRSAATLGEAAIEAGVASPDDRALAELVKGVETADDPGQALLAKIREQVRHDFTHGRIVRLDGWFLAQTEVDLCARFARLD